MSKKFLLTVSGDSVEEVIESLKKLNQTFGLEVVKVGEDESPQPRRGRGRPPKDVATELAATPIDPSPEPQAVAPAPVTAPTSLITREDVNGALKSVLEQKGLGSAQIVLKKFEAKRASEVKDSDFGRFLDECQSVLKA